MRLPGPSEVNYATGVKERPCLESRLLLLPQHPVHGETAGEWGSWGGVGGALQASGCVPKPGFLHIFHSIEINK